LELRAHPSDAVCDTGVLCLICNLHQDQCQETKYWMHYTCTSCPWRLDPAKEVKPCSNGDHYTFCDHCYDNRPQNLYVILWSSSTWHWMQANDFDHWMGFLLLLTVIRVTTSGQATKLCLSLAHRPRQITTINNLCNP
jgi:hypothetical protein